MKLYEADLSISDQETLLNLQKDVIDKKIDLLKVDPDDKKTQAQIKADMADLQAKMQDYRESIQEKFVTSLNFKGKYSSSEYLEIFQNPSISEVDEFEWMRGALLPSGDLYLVGSSNDSGSDVFHTEVLKIFAKLGIIKNATSQELQLYYTLRPAMEKFLAIMQNSTTNEIILSESYYIYPTPKVEAQYLLGFKRKNPSWKLDFS